MKISTMFLRWLARSSDRLVQFITDLDAELDRLIAKYDADALNLEAHIEEVHFSASERITKIEAETDAAVDSLRTQIADTEKGAAVLKNIKNGLPTAN